MSHRCNPQSWAAIEFLQARLQPAAVIFQMIMGRNSLGNNNMMVVGNIEKVENDALGSWPAFSNVADDEGSIR